MNRMYLLFPKKKFLEEWVISKITEHRIFILLPGKERVTNFSTYVRTLTETEAIAESQRCLNCGCGEGCGLCASICAEFAIHVVAPDVWEINPEECVACGMCFNRCPNKNIEMVNLNVLVG